MKKLLKLFFVVCLMFTVAACQPKEEVKQENNESTTVKSNSKILIAYFSLYGNVDYDENTDASTSASIVIRDDKKLGATEYIADRIQEKTGGEKYLIEVSEKYPDDFQSVIDQGHKETDENILPKISSRTLSLDDYDTIFIGYPVWATGTPKVIESFMNQYDFTNKTVIPFCTHDGYGSGHSFDDVKEYSKSHNVLDGIVIDSSEITDSDSDVNQWIESLNLDLKSESQSDELAIQIGEHQLNGVLNDSGMASQFKALLPQTISMVHYGNREFYGGFEQTIDVKGEGQYRFENGDITYCPSNNTIAIFYNHSDRPELTMEVYVIGKVTSDLSLFHELSSQEDITFSIK